MSREAELPDSRRPSKLVALTLLLTVPVMMTGCNQLTDEECDPSVESDYYCEYDDDVGKYYKSKKKKSSGVTAYGGFGSGGKSVGSGG